MTCERPDRRRDLPATHGPDRRARRRRQRRPDRLWEVCEARLLLANFSLSIADAPPVARPDQGFATAAFTVTLSPANIETPTTVHFTTVDGTATAANGDYVPTSGTLTIPTEQQTATILVQIPVKTAAETNKTFFVDLSQARGAVITGAVGMGTIIDTHPAGRVQFSSPTYQVNSTDTSATVTITRTGGNASDVAATFTTTTGGSAVPNVDYTPVTRQVVFGFDQQTATVVIPINAQALSVQDLTVNLLLENPTGGATLGAQDTATLVIRKVNPLIVTTTADNGLGSLRTAITFADSTAAPADPVIRFAIVREGRGPHTITPLTRLPELTRPVTIDATTQPGYLNKPVIILSGLFLQRTDHGADPANGLVATAGGSSIIGLAIGNFPGSGIVLGAPGHDRVVHNVIGADPSGVQARPNLADGVFVDGSPANTVAANVISGNGNVGVQLFGPGATGNVLYADSIGTNSAGGAALPNAFDGVFLNNAPGNTLVGNLISGNRNVGVQAFQAGAFGNVVRGNVIGTNLAGNAAIPNALDGVFLNNAPRNTVTANLISGNGSIGVQALGPGATGDLIQGNKIGTDLAGRLAVANLLDGVFLNNAPGNVVSNNLISGNGSVGIQALGPGATGEAILGNKIGTDATGDLAVANLLDGVFLNNAPGNVVSNNLISGNGSSGIQIFGPGATGDAIRGNVIGLGAGNLPLGNNYGVFLNGAPGPGAGGPAAQNVIRGNRVAAVFRTLTATDAANSPGAVKTLAVVSNAKAAGRSGTR